MNMMPLGDYYVWYCEWCDSRNLTLWTRVEKGEVYCGACHQRFNLGSMTCLGKESSISQAIL